MGIAGSGWCCAVVSNVSRGLSCVYSDGLAGGALSARNRQADGVGILSQLAAGRAPQEAVAESWQGWGVVNLAKSSAAGG